VDHPVLAPGLALGCLGLWFAVRMPRHTIKTYLKALSVFMAFVLALQTLFGPGERYILRPLIPEYLPIIGGTGSLKWDGLMLGMVICCRVAALTLLMPMLTMSTGPRLLALGLARLGLPYKAAFIATTALNLIPAFEEDVRIIMDAQKLRGMRAFEEGTLMDKCRAYPALVLPLVIGAMRRAQLLGTAMDARGFGAFRTRTWLAQIRMSPLDYTVCAAGAVFAASMLTLNWALP
jgi:energy-coupling factor transport system permease protein